MKKKLISFLLLFSMIMPFATAPTIVQAASISIGEYVQMGTYYGVPILWRCVDIDENGALMLSDKIICSKAFDAMTSSDGTSSSHSRSSVARSMYGSNCWSDSNIRSWLNSSENAGAVKWLCANPPAGNYVNLHYNPYSDEAGFLTNFTQNEIAAVKAVTQKSISAYSEWNEGIYTSGTAYHLYEYDIANVVQNYDSAYAEQVTDTMFLLDVKQINAVYNNSNILGDEYYLGYPTEQCVENNTNNRLKSTETINYWLRTPNAVDGDNSSKDAYAANVRCVNYRGEINDQFAYAGECGVRPAFYLADNANLVGSGTESSPYTVSSSSASTETPVATTEPTTEIITAGLVTSFNSSVSQWSSEEMEEAYTANLIPENLVSEDLTKRVSRSEFASIAVKLYEALSGESAEAASTPFTDIASDKNAAEIAKAYGLDITAGTSSTTFEPNTEINREQLAAMLCRTIKKYKFEDWTNDTDSEYYLDSEGVKKFADDDQISDYAKQSVYYMAKMGIISGIDDTHFAPKNTTDEQEANGYATATREQAIALSLRIYKLSDLWK